MPQYQAMQKFVLGDVWDFNPLPPANSSAIAKPKEIIVLTQPQIQRAYPKAGVRIA
jgi:hypothetical protein